MDGNLVTIERREYEELLEQSLWLSALEMAGLDNWIGSGVAIEIMENWEKENEEEPLGEISATVIADSVSPSGVRLTTLELRYPRFIHSEFMTHRMFSRNSFSSRAMPIQKVLDQVAHEPAVPIHWGKNQPGMQAREELGLAEIQKVSNQWYIAASDAAFSAGIMEEAGLHKQVVNRILEPFQYITVVVTATEWDNFFKLRDHEDAQPEIRILAQEMQRAMDRSEPTEIYPWSWHTPYAHPDSETQGEAIKTSVAGCARVTYLNHDGSTRTVEKDLKLYNQLLEAGHLSPFEHQATPMGEEQREYLWEKGITHRDRDGDYWSGNFRGWLQNRQVL